MAVGLVATYVINILRLLLIIAFLHWGGKDVIFLAHTVIGRGVFFILVVAVYWFVFTRAALRVVRERVERA
jgi:exosortase/archaeosortase family protein